MRAAKKAARKNNKLYNNVVDVLKNKIDKICKQTWNKIYKKIIKIKNKYPKFKNIKLIINLNKDSNDDSVFED